MGYSGNISLQSSLRDWLSLERWRQPFAVTLTLRQCVTVPNGTMPTKVWLTDTAATQNLRHFLNKLNRTVFGKAAMRFGRGVGCVPILEGGSFKRLHYHAMLDCPRSDLTAEFPSIVAEHWRSTQWGYWQIDCQSDPDEGWLTYMTKFRDKPNFADAIDWTNLRLP